jgi:hypothetical protein
MGKGFFKIIGMLTMLGRPQSADAGRERDHALSRLRSYRRRESTGAAVENIHLIPPPLNPLLLSLSAA